MPIKYLYLTEVLLCNPVLGHDPLLDEYCAKSPQRKLLHYNCPRSKRRRHNKNKSHEATLR